jgi:hypothetical protein
MIRRCNDVEPLEPTIGDHMPCSRVGGPVGGNCPASQTDHHVDPRLNETGRGRGRQGGDNEALPLTSEVETVRGRCSNRSLLRTNTPGDNDRIDEDVVIAVDLSVCRQSAEHNHQTENEFFHGTITVFLESPRLNTGHTAI